MVEQREAAQQDKISRAECQHTGGENRFFGVFVIQTKTDDAVGYAKADQRNKQVGCLHHKAYITVFRRGEDSGVNRHKQKNKKFAAETAYEKQYGVGCQKSVSVH